MQYSILGKTGLKVSRLGFGCMRLPMKSAAEVDRDKAIPMLRRAVELGITYFDTAVGYCGGDSQRVLGEAMEKIRGKVILSTKNPHYAKDDKKGWWKNLEDSLERLRTNHIDIYNFHGMSYERYELGVAGEDGLYKEMLKAKEQGLIRHICHSFHGTLESLKKCIDTGLFESVTLQYNLLDQSLEEGIVYAAEHGMGVVVMGPVGGGRLGYPSEKAAELVGGVKSTPELALRFVVSNENVILALSGMSTIEQLEENVATVSGAGKLTLEDHKKIEAAVEERKKLAGLYCTGCNYCMPCPDGVDIPANFEILNAERVFGLTEHAKSRYAALGGKAALCRQCGKCVELCPQELDIPARLGEAVALLDERSGSVAGWSELHGVSGKEPGIIILRMRYHIKNYTPDSFDKVTVKLHAHREEQVSPDSFEFTHLKAYGRRHKDLEVTALSFIETLSLDNQITFNGSNTLEHLYHILATGTKIESGKPVYKNRSLPVIHVPGPIHPAHTSEQPIDKHCFDFSAAYNAENLYIRVDVEDDLVWTHDKANTGRNRADYLRIFLDSRKPAELGRGGSTEEVMHISVSPPSRGSSETVIVTSNKAEIEADLQHSDYGYIVHCTIPWSAFVQAEERRQIIGFDIVLVSFDDKGKRNVRLSWTGRENQERNTAAFGKLLLP
jgi:predicted aldo/keto reductase-like oxidoreductase